MYGRVLNRKIDGYRGEAIALLLEYNEAKQKADSTNDLNPQDFLPENWHSRLKKLIAEEDKKS